MKLLVSMLLALVSTAVGAQDAPTPSTDDIIFYESFDKIMGTGGNDDSFTPGEAMTQNDKSLLDNSSGVSYDRISKGYKCIYMGTRNAYSYTTPSLSVVPMSKVLLSFRMAARTYYVAQSDYLTIECTGGASLSTSKFTAEKEIWNTYYTVVDNMETTTKFTFKCGYSFLDDITMYAVPSSLDQSRNNSTYIIANADQTLDVQLIRTLTPNIWCPLCLPFDVTKTKMEAAMGTTCELCTLSNIDDGVFKFEIATSTIPAGTPFLVRVNETVTNPEFTGVTIVNTPAATATASTDDYKFVGTYSPIDLETDGSNLFLATDGKLYTPESAPNNRLGGLRAYFVVPPTANTARVMIPETTSNISSSWEVSPSNCYELYDLRGQRTNNPNAKGLYIHGGKTVLIP